MFVVRKIVISVYTLGLAIASLWWLIELWFINTSKYANSFLAVFAVAIVLPVLQILYQLVTGTVRRRWFINICLLLLIIASSASLFYGDEICNWLEIPLVSYGVYPGMQVNTGICCIALLVCLFEYQAEMRVDKCSKAGE